MSRTDPLGCLVSSLVLMTLLREDHGSSAASWRSATTSRSSSTLWWIKQYAFTDVAIELKDLARASAGIGHGKGERQRSGAPEKDSLQPPMRLRRDPEHSRPVDPFLDRISGP